jgi:hypothetical protein
MNTDWFEIKLKEQSLDVKDGWFHNLFVYLFSLKASTEYQMISGLHGKSFCLDKYVQSIVICGSLPICFSK